eukprot:gnl/TRDRNA2_/TRDRNA2_150623_c1_seq1.p1 gnl/TRDRNA2_/TRDRNA2_150623_c1~~gnl/TRDRNA2_/TRDRNA2_150623_c1_seq1.p1  ORF type:complete len:207 (-),score=22.34 gnl/TRDRNA2_/TRDRNA2_150623_c1_seq1:66-686(-)
MRRGQLEEANCTRVGNSHLRQKRYAHIAYSRAMAFPRIQSGFRKKLGPVGKKLAETKGETVKVVQLKKEAAGETRAIRSACIIGSWDDWTSVSRMTWNSCERSYSFHVTAAEFGNEGWASFQILSNGETDKRVYPNCANASPFVQHDVCGPDDMGHHLTWTIGKNSEDNNAERATFEVKFYLNDDGTPKSVMWRRSGARGSLSRKL